MVSLYWAKNIFREMCFEECFKLLMELFLQITAQDMVYILKFTYFLLFPQVLRSDISPTPPPCRCWGKYSGVSLRCLPKQKLLKYTPICYCSCCWFYCWCLPTWQVPRNKEEGPWLGCRLAIPLTLCLSLSSARDSIYLICWIECWSYTERSIEETENEFLYQAGAKETHILPSQQLALLPHQMRTLLLAWAAVAQDNELIR